MAGLLSSAFPGPASAGLLQAGLQIGVSASARIYVYLLATDDIPMGHVVVFLGSWRETCEVM